MSDQLILVAEDNEINALLMRSLLTRLGHHAVITTNGEQALESWLSARSAGARPRIRLIAAEATGRVCCAIEQAPASNPATATPGEAGTD